MKRTNFLAKLKKENKIQIVKPSEVIRDAYIERSEESLRSAKALYEINSLKDSVALTYYSISETNLNSTLARGQAIINVDYNR